MELTDAKLIERLKQGDERAYSELYDQHYVFLCYVANSYVKDRFTAETIVGDMIFHLWEIRETLVISTSLRSYLSRAVRNRCVNYLLSKNSVHEIHIADLIDGNVPEKTPLEDSPLDKMLGREMEETIIGSVSKLSKECETVFRKSRVEEKKYAQIASEMGISTNTVKYHIKNALTILRKDIKKLFMLFYLFLTTLP